MGTTTYIVIKQGKTTNRNVTYVYRFLQISGCQLPVNPTKFENQYLVRGHLETHLDKCKENLFMNPYPDDPTYHLHKN